MIADHGPTRDRLLLTACACTPPYGADLTSLPQTPDAPQSIATATNLIFHDEFTGTKLNTKIWYRCYNWANETQGCKTTPGELEESTNPATSRSRNGHLNPPQKHEPKDVPNGKPYTFTSGIIQTGGSPANAAAPRRSS